MGDSVHVEDRAVLSPDRGASPLTSDPWSWLFPHFAQHLPDPGVVSVTTAGQRDPPGDPWAKSPWVVQEW